MKGLDIEDAELEDLVLVLRKAQHSCVMVDPAATAFDQISPEARAECRVCRLSSLRGTLEAKLRRHKTPEPLELDEVLARDEWSATQIVQCGFEPIAAAYAIKELRDFDRIAIVAVDPMTRERLYSCKVTGQCRGVKAELFKAQQRVEDERAITEARERLSYGGM